MAARPGMTDLLSTLRGMTDAGTADYTIAGVPYWSDTQLQDVLDKHRYDIRSEVLMPQPSYVPGGVEYYQYNSSFDNFEATTGGTAIFIIKDGVGNVQGTATYTADYVTGRIEFASNTGGVDYYLTGRSYDLNAAASDVWKRKASQVAKAFSFSTDNMRVDKGAMVRSYMDMANAFQSMARPQNYQMLRGDEPPMTYHRWGNDVD